jgi:hypothetical protein
MSTPMRRLALIAALALIGCAGEETGEGGACAAALVHDGMLYRGTDVDAGRGVRSGDLIEEGFSLPGCNDGGGPEPDRSTTVFAVRGVSPEVAVIDDASLYVNAGYFTELPDHPLHEVLHDGPSKSRRGGSPCMIDGRVLETFFSLWMQTQRGQRMSVAIDVHTRIEGFDRAGLPYLEEDDAIRVHGRCQRGAVLARRIEPVA